MITDEQAKATLAEDTSYAFEQAKMQRYAALSNALSTIDAFALTSCSPEQYDSFDKLREFLLSVYVAAN